MKNLISQVFSNQSDAKLCQDVVRQRSRAYLWLCVLLFAIYIPFAFSGWKGNTQLHTITEVVATLLAAVVGVIALVRFYTRKCDVLLYIGCGFLGTAFLDGYHSVVTSSYFSSLFPSAPPSLIPWSWNASRMFLAILMCLSWWAWRWEKNLNARQQHREGRVYFVVSALTLVSFCFFAFVPLPKAYYPELFFGRPEEFLPALFFAIALIGYLKKGAWKFDVFEHWCVFSLIIGLFSQAVVMSRSFGLFDAMFDYAHILKVSSYGCVLVGLLANMFHLFRQANLMTDEIKKALQAQEEAYDRQVEVVRQLENAHDEIQQQEKRYRGILENVVDAVINISKTGIVEDFNPAAEKMFGYGSEEVVGNNIKMLMPAPDQEKHDGYLANYAATGKKTIVGASREMIGKRKDGTTFPIHLSVSEVHWNSSQDETLHFYTGFIRDLTKQREVEAKLINATKVAEAATKSKSEFLANMSHEIRTPMTAIIGFTDILLGEDGLENAPPERVNAFETIKRNGDYLLQLINDILDLSKIESGKVDVEKIESSPSEILNDVVSLMNVRARAKGLTLEVEYETALPEQIKSDPTRLRQILINLIGNAIKFTEVGKIKVVVRLLNADSNSPEIQFDIIDQGIGLSSLQIEKLFQPFVQADTSTTRKFGGTGLGLTISKRLAEMLGGGIKVQSESEKGSTFTLTISAGCLKNVKKINSPAENQIPQIPVKKTAPAKTPSLDCRILLAEDGPDNQKLISFLLKKAGARVTVAENGQIAYDLALAAREDRACFDVILMDMQMPVLDGYSATRKLREANYTNPIIALTAHAMSHDKAKCLNAGCDDYTTKPIDRPKLISLIAKYAQQPNQVDGV